MKTVFFPPQNNLLETPAHDTDTRSPEINQRVNINTMTERRVVELPAQITHLTLTSLWVNKSKADSCANSSGINGDARKTKLLSSKYE